MAKRSTKKVAKAAKRATKKVSKSNARGRSSSLSGKTLFASAEVRKANPRRPKSHGFKSLEVIRKAGKGIAYAAAVAAGARPVDIRWDVEHKNVVAR